MGKLRASSPSGEIAVATVEHVEQGAALTTEALYRRHAERVWRYCLHFLRRPVDAEDALQQTFLQAHRALGRGVEPEAEAAWLLAIARNVCLTRADTHRRRGRTEVPEDPRLLDVVAAADGDDQGVSDEVRAALARLPERQRQALFLREWQECSYAEIAAALGTSESAVETLLFRARRTLARELGASKLRHTGDLAGLLGWLRMGLAPAASKVVVGVAVVAVAVVGSDVATQGHHPGTAAVAHPARVRHAVVAERPAVVTPHRAMRGRALVSPRRTHVRPREHLAIPSSPVAAAPPPAAPAPAASRPVERAAAPSPAAAPAPPAAVPVPSAAAETTTAVTTTATNVADTVAQAAATAAPAAAPVVTTVAQTVSGAASAVDSTAETATSTVSQLLPGH